MIYSSNKKEGEKMDKATKLMFSALVDINIELLKKIDELNERVDALECLNADVEALARKVNKNEPRKLKTCLGEIEIKDFFERGE